MSMRRAHLIAWLLTAGALAAGCGDPTDIASVVYVTVTAGSGVPFVSQLRATMSNQGDLKVNTYPPAPAAAPIMFPATFVVTLPEARSGNLDIALDALDAGGAVVANGAGRAMIVVGGRVDVTIMLAAGTPLCGNTTIDIGESCDDGNRRTGDGCDYQCQVEAPPWTGPLPKITEFVLPTPGAFPERITTGSDGNLWFTESQITKIGRSTPAGAINELALSTGTTNWPGDIILGPDSNVWFTVTAGSGIWRVTPAGEISMVPATSPYAYPSVLTVGPDGNVWMGMSGHIGRLNADGTVTNFTIPSGTSDVGGIARGPDGNIWFTADGSLAGGTANNIGRITTAGQIVEFTIPTPKCRPSGIAAGPDDNLWFTEYDAGKIGRITVDGKITEFTLPTPNAPAMIIAGPDGNMWFTEYGDRIGRITPGGGINEFPTPTSDAEVLGITVGPDHNIWFTEAKTWRIGRLEL